MLTKIHRNTIFLVHTSAQPTQSEWDEYMSQLAILEQGVGGNLERAGLLVFTDGGAPNAMQRNQVNSWLNGRQWPVGVILSSPLIRGIAIAMSWFNKSLRIFAPKEWQEAMVHAQVMPNDLREVREIVEELAAKLGGVKTVSDAFGGDARVKTG